jgi:uncharacterized protein DUF6458
MGIGGSIFLLAVGAIIAFGVRDTTLGPLDLTVVGWVLMLAGLVGLLLTLWFWNSRRRRVAVTPAPPATTVTPTRTATTVERDTVRRSTTPEVVEEETWTQAPDRRL